VTAEEPDHLSIVCGGKTWHLQLYNYETREYVSLTELQNAIGGSVEWENNKLGAIYRYGGGKFRFEDGIPFFSFDQRPYQLVEQPLFLKDEFLLPLQFISDYLPYFFPDLFSFDMESVSLRDRRFYTFIREVRRSSKPGETIVFFLSSFPPRFEIDSSRPGTLLLNVFETQCNPVLGDSVRAFGYIDSTRIIESGKSAQILFFLKPSVQRYRVAEVKVPSGISVIFSGEKKTKDREMTGDMDLVSGIIDPDEFVIRTIAIDPGHGGKDPGAIGKKGVKEKDVNLKVALKLAELMKKKTDMKVFMTRKVDSYISLSDRTKIANKKNADLFVSIHCNASRKKDLRGFEAYFLSVAKTDEERAVALRENLSVRFEEPSADSASLNDLQFIFWDLAQNEFLRESNEWAGMMCREFDDGSKIRSRGVRQAGFFVLNDAHMPSILLELGYLSNPAEEDLLGNRKYQYKLAEQIFKGIENYIERYNKKLIR
jgi:N-acetylmuramoyl-L-alanine amidase